MYGELVVMVGPALVMVVVVMVMVALVMVVVVLVSQQQEYSLTDTSNRHEQCCTE
jgi:preprotein translocase subunit SecG